MFLNKITQLIGEKKIAENSSILFVNDGSRDNTLFQLKKLYAAHKCPTKVVSFSRNFGKEAAVYAGMREAVGEYVALIDADLQQRPEIVRDMVKILDEQPEYDVVAAYQDRRGEGKVLSFFKRSFYSVINRLSDVKFRPDASDFRCFRKSVADSILSMTECHRFSKGIFSWVGFNTYFMPYEAQQRNAGQTSWSFRKLFKYAIHGIEAFTTAPLNIATYVGGFSALLSGIYMLVVFIQKLFFGIDVPGYATLVVLILFIGGIQMLMLGIMGQYIAKIYIEGKRRPVYIAKEYLESGKADPKV